jgi:hypothetical protein
MGPDGEPALERHDSALAALLALFEGMGGGRGEEGGFEEEDQMRSDHRGGEGHWSWRCLGERGHSKILGVASSDHVRIYAFSRSSECLRRLGVLPAQGSHGSDVEKAAILKT